MNLDPDTVAKVLAPLASTLVVGLFTAAIWPVLRPSRALRHDLEQDAKIVDALPKAAGRALREDMGSRAHVVVAFSRYPSVTRVELATAMFVLLLSGGSIANATIEDVPRTAGYFNSEAFWIAGLAALFSCTAAALALTTWGERTVGRIDYVERELEPELADDVVRSTQLTYLLMRIVMRAVILGPLVLNLSVWFVRGLPYRGFWDSFFVALPTALTIFMVFVIRTSTRVPEVGKRVNRLGPMFHEVTLPEPPPSPAPAARDDADGGQVTERPPRRFGLPLRLKRLRTPTSSLDSSDPSDA